MGRTFAIGDIHGDLTALDELLGRLPLEPTDTLVLLGDYVDSGPQSREVVERVMGLPSQVPAKVVALRGNHEDSWLRVVDTGFLEFVLPRGNGCLEALRSYEGRPMPAKGEAATMEEMKRLFEGSFLPASHVAFMRSLPYFYEDEHAIYVHGGLPQKKGVFLHPSEVKPPTALCWCRDKAFFRDYRGKLVVFGHTATEYLPPELSSYTPEDPKDLWAGPCCAGIDTRCGKGGYLTALELPNRYVYESRRPPSVEVAGVERS